MELQAKKYIKENNDSKIGKKIKFVKLTEDGFIYSVKAYIRAGMDGKIHTIKKIGTKNVFFRLKQNSENKNDFYYIPLN
tara:strand:+ start:355 stop:591 length:237 start_codon:yes stop_codon:yes gene_type:complete